MKIRTHGLALLLFLTVGCDRHTSPVVTTVDIDAIVRNIDLGGYDGYITFDWDVINSSDRDISGWEISIHLETSDQKAYQGIFFNHETPLSVGDTIRFTNNVLFHVDANNVYPVLLESNALGIRNYGVNYRHGIIRE